MRSVADDLRLESLRAMARLKVSERIALALRLGDEDRCVEDGRPAARSPKPGD
jgi:hypothetical protein